MWSIALVAAHLASLSAQTPSRPNLAIVLADDLGYCDLGSLGSRSIRTPWLDRTVAVGQKRTNFYVQPACSLSVTELRN